MVLTPAARVSFLFVLASSGTLFAQSTFNDLGAAQTASGVSMNGVVVGTNPSGYFRWTAAGGLVNIGGTAPGGGVGGQAKISNDGVYTCGTFLNPASGSNEMSRWSSASSSWLPFGGIGGSSGVETSSGWSISGDGRCTVGLGWVNGGTAHAIRRLDGGATIDLGSTVANRSTRANGVNTSGSVIVGWQDAASGFRQGAIWTNGVQTLITLASNGQPLGEAQDVSDVGTVVVGTGVSANQNQAWRWTAATGGQSLGALNPTWIAAATAVSDDGNTIIGYERPFGSPAVFGTGFIWRQGVGMTDLKTYLVSKGVPVPAAFTLALPLGISADGRTIVGLGRNGGIASGFVAKIDDCSGKAQAYGAGLAGTGNYVPFLEVNGCPAIGSSFAIDLTSVRGGASGLLFVGLSQTAVPLLGGTFLVGSLALSLPIGVSGTPGAAAAGSLSLPATLTDPALIGLTLTMQAAFSDAGAIFGASLTNGVSMTIG